MYWASSSKLDTVEQTFTFVAYCLASALCLGLISYKTCPLSLFWCLCIDGAWSQKLHVFMTLTLGLHWLAFYTVDVVMMEKTFQMPLPGIDLLVGFEVLMAVSTKMAVFWVVVLCNLVEVYQRIRGPCCLLHHQGNLMMEAASTSEMLVSFYHTTWCYNPEDSHLLSNLFPPVHKVNPHSPPPPPPSFLVIIFAYCLP
jgi:hypothetical protein